MNSLLRPLLASIGVGLILFSSTMGQRHEKAPRAKFARGSSVTVPLDIDNNIIRLKVRVNGSRELTMIFDTGASITGVDEHFVKELGLKTTGDKLNGSGTGGNFTGGYVASSTLSVDGAEVTGQPLAVFKINAPPGFDFDGIIGYDFIKAFVVEIDYESKTMRLHDPQTYRYSGRGLVVPLQLAGRKTPLIATKLSGATIAVSPNLELDTGFDAAFSLGGRYVAEHRLLRNLNLGTESTAHGAGGEQRRVLVTFLRGSFAGIRFRAPQVFLSLEKTGADADKTSDGVIGGEVLRRFRVVIDYTRSRMILEKNSHFDDPFAFDDSE